MHRYKVLVADPQSALVALVDESGRCYVGRATTKAPRRGLILVGEPPAVGLRALKCVDVGEPYPVSLAVIDCDLLAAWRVAGGMNRSAMAP